MQNSRTALLGITVLAAGFILFAGDQFSDSFVRGREARPPAARTDKKQGEACTARRLTSASNEYPLIEFAVQSTPAGGDIRDAVRKTWGSVAVAAGYPVLFYIGGTDLSPEVKQAVAAEVEKYGDLVVLDMQDGYEMLTLKTLNAFTYAARCSRARYVAKVDHDVHVSVHRLAERLGQLEPVRDGPGKLGYYFGRLYWASSPMRNAGHKNHDTTEYPWERLPPYAAGPFYVLSAAVVRYLGRNAAELNTRCRANEDVAMGMWLLGADVVHTDDQHIHIADILGAQKPYLAVHATDTVPKSELRQWLTARLAEDSAPADGGGASGDGASASAAVATAVR